MTFDDFIKKYTGIGIDFDKYYGFMYMDLVEQYNQDVVGAPRLYGNAVDVWNNYPKDFYTRIENKPDNAPDEGDIIIWSQGVGQFGHIAICKESDFAKFISFDQNWPVGSVCHFQDHNYTNVLGWLKPKAQVITPPVPPQPVMSDQVKIPLGEYGELEIQQIKGKLGDLNRIEKQLDEYPILDEDNYSQLENEEMHECWESFACEEFIYKMGKEFNLKDPTVDFLLDLDQNRILEFYLSFANDPYWEEGNGLYFNIEDIVQNQMERKDLVNFIKKMKKNIIKVKEN